MKIPCLKTAVPIYQILGLGLNNRSVLSSSLRKTFKNFLSAFLCLPKLVATPAPGLTRGAFTVY